MVLHRWKLTALIALGLAVSAGTTQAQSVLSNSGSVSISDGSYFDTYSGDAYGDVAGFVPFGGGGYFWMEGMFGERPGNRGNYGTAGAFIPGPRDENGMFFADVQLMVDEEAHAGVDANLGYRWLLGNSFLGVYGALTRDYSEYEYSYNQYGFGAEYARSIFSVSSNFYIPVNGDDLNPVAPRTLTGNATVQDTVFGFIDRQVVEQHMRGGDIIARAYIPTQEWLQGGVGYYHYRAPDGDDVNGVHFIANADFNEVQVNLDVTHDNQFGTSTNLGLAWILGRGGVTTDHSQMASVNRRLFDRLQKQRRVATQTFETDVFTPYINPETGRPYRIVYANNTNLMPGTGALLNPYAQLDFANGSNADLIVVQRGSTSPTTKLTAGDGLFMTAGQTLIGDGTPFFIDVAGRGSFLVPGLDPMGPNPYVTANPGASIINIASNTLVDGLNLMPAVGGFAIRGQALSNFEIRNINNDVTPAMSTGPGAGIMLSNVSGRGIIDNVAFNISDPTAIAGIGVHNSGVGPLDLTINNVPFLLGGRNGVRLYANSSIINATADGVLADMNGTGLELETNGPGEINLAVTNSTFTNAGGGALMIPPGPGVPVPGPADAFGVLPADGSEGTGHGVNIIATSGTINLAMTDTDVSTPLNDGLHAEINSFANVDLDIASTMFTGAGRDGMRFMVDRSDVNMTLDDVDLSMVGRNAFNVETSNFANFNGTIDNSNLDGAGVDAFHLLANTDSRITLDVADTTADMPGRIGLWVGGMMNGFVDASFDNLTMTGAGSHAIFGNLDGMSTALLRFTDSDLSAPGGNGLLVSALNGSAFSADFTDTDISGAAGDAFGMTLDGSTGMLVLDGVDAADAVGSSILVTAVNGSTVGIDSAATDLSRAGLDGINIGLNNSNAMLFVEGTLVDDVGRDALRLQANNGSTANVDIADSSFTNAGENAYDLGFRSGSSIDIRVEGTPSQGAGAEGLKFDGDNADLYANFINSNLSTLAMGTGGDGVNGRLDNGATANLRLASSAVANAGGDGMDIIADNGSMFTGNVLSSPFIDAAGNAFSVELDNASIGVLNIDNSPGSNAGADGLYASADNGSSFTGTLTNGTVFDNVGGTPINLFAGTGSTTTVNGDGVSGAMAGSDGIYAEASGGTINVALTNVGSFLGAGDDGVELFADAGTINFNMQGNPIANFAMAANEGFVGDFINGSIGLINLTDVNFNGAGADGLDLEATDSVVNTTITRGFFNNEGSNAVDLSFERSTGTLLLNDVWGVNAGDDAIEVSAADNSNLNIEFQNGVRLDNAGNDAIDIVSNASVVSLTSSGGVSGANAAADAIHLEATDGGSISVLMPDAGDFSGAGDDAIDFAATTGSSVTINVAGTMGTPANFSGAGDDGVVGSLSGGSTGTVNLTDTTFNGAGGNGMTIDADMSSFNGLVLRTNLADAGANAVNLDFTTSTGTLFVSNSNLDNAGIDGMHIEAAALSSLDVDVIDSSVMGAGDDAFEVVMSGFSTVDLFVDPTDATGAGSNGLEITGSTGGSLVATFIDSPLSNAANPTGAEGVLANLTGGSSATLNLTRSDVESTGGAGIYVTANGGSNFTATVVDSSLADAAGSAIDILVDDSNGTVTLNNVDASGAGVDGLAIIANNGGTYGAFLNNVQLDDAGNVALGASANASNITISGTGVSGSNAGNHGISLSSSNGSNVQLGLTNTGSFANATNIGLAMAGSGASTVNANVQGTMGTPADFSGAPGGFTVDLTGGSTGGLLLTDVTATGATIGYGANVVGSTFNSTVTRGDFSNAALLGVFLQSTGASNSTVTMNNSQVNGSMSNAFGLLNGVGSTLDLNLNNVTAMGANNNSMELVTAGTTMIDIVAGDFSGAGNSIVEWLQTAGTFDMNVTNTNMSGAGGDGLNGIVGGTTNFDFMNVDLSGSGGTAVHVEGSGTFNGMFTDATMNNSGGAFELLADGGGMFDVITDNTSATNTTGNTVELFAFNGSTVNFEANNALDMSTTGGDHVIYARSVADSNIDLDIENADPLDPGTARAVLSGASVSGLRGFAGQNSDITLNLDGVDIANNTGVGVDFAADALGPADGSSISGRIAHSMITNNLRGVVATTNTDASLDDQSLIDLDFQFANVDSNNGDGFHLVANNGDDTALMQDTGIIIDFDSGTIRFNDDGVAANGEGDGIDATANGDNSVAGNTRITVNLTNTFNILNEEMNERETENGMGQVDILP